MVCLFELLQLFKGMRVQHKQTARFCIIDIPLCTGYIASGTLYPSA